MCAKQRTPNPNVCMSHLVCMNYIIRTAQNKSALTLGEFSYFILLSKFPNQLNRVETVSQSMRVCPIKKFFIFVSISMVLFVSHLASMCYSFSIRRNDLYSNSRSKVASGY